MKLIQFCIYLVTLCSGTYACEDDKNYFWKRNLEKGCSWVRDNGKCHAMDPKNEQKYSSVKALNFCRSSCGECPSKQDSCEDDSSYSWKRNVEKRCSWVRDNGKCHAIDPKNEQKYSNVKVLNFCKSSCGECSKQVSLEDNPSYSFRGVSKKDCAWIGKNCSKRCTYKDKRGREKIFVRNECAKTCDLCEGSSGKSNSSASSSTTNPPTKKDIGDVCQNSNECVTNQCDTRNSGYAVCVQNQKCRGLDGASWSTDYNEDMIILVYIGSAFTSTNDFVESVTKTHDEIKKVEMFNNANNPERMRYRAFYVEKTADSFCHYGCDGVDRLLCCEQNKARNLANLCFPARSTLQTIVIHNDEKYGGAGYALENMAVISRNIVGPKLAVHELGHSLFEFGDEYSYGEATHEKANCDVVGCPKWNDMDTKGKLCKVEGGKNNDFYVGANSFMRNMFMPVGSVNLRFTCCTYLALTKEVPAYCDEFEQFGNGLRSYCMKDYQNYGMGSYNRGLRNLRSAEDGTEASSNEVSRHNSISIPTILDIDLKSKQFRIISTNTTSTMFRHHHLHGEYKDIEAAKAAGLDSAHAIEIFFASGDTKRLVFGPHIIITAPPPNPFENNETIAVEGHGHESSVRNDREHVQVVLDKSLGGVAHVEIRKMHW